MRKICIMAVLGMLCAAQESVFADCLYVEGIKETTARRCNEKRRILCNPLETSSHTRTKPFLLCASNDADANKFNQDRKENWLLCKKFDDCK